MASSSSNNIPIGHDFRPSYVAQAVPRIIKDLRNSERNNEDKLSILNNFLSKCHEELYQFPQNCPMLLHGIDLLKKEIEMIEDVMGYGYVVEEKQQLDLNDPIVDPEQQAHNPTHEQYKRQETNQADSFVPDLPQSKLIPIGLNLKPIESAMEIKYMPLTKPIWKKDRILWTPELHARFVASLHVLGGPEAAKPKQITASMQVAGLTTDQVKSHLQRYRQIWRSEREGLQ